MKKSNNLDKITIIVNTCDKFSDCWNIFFKLFEKYWSGCKSHIILTTYEKKYDYHGKLKIENLCAKKEYEFEPAWSEILLSTLNKLSDSDIVMLMLDDFFISDYVDEDTISSCYEIMEKNNYSNITLTNHDKKRTYHKTKNPLLFKIDSKSRYRITTSPALWRVSALKKYLIGDENPWMFELFGTIRSHKIKDTFFRVNENMLKDSFKEVVPYFEARDGDSAIVKGKWQVGVDKFLNKEGFNIDFTKRGFFKPKKFIFRKLDTFLTIAKYPNQTLRALFSKI